MAPRPAMLKQDYVQPVFADGPKVTDPGFAAWLAAQGVVKLPFTVWRRPRRVGAIGVHAAQPAVVFRFHDGALGVPLDERLHALCGDEEPCRVWLAGRVGESLPLPGGDPKTAFGVHRVYERVEGGGPHYAQSVRGDACLAIRSLRAGHCARGPARCGECRATDARPAAPRLLDVCPYGDRARPTIEVERGGTKSWRPYDVLHTFATEAEAREFAERHQLTDVRL